jgi:2-polyprenyl-6-methoxyphenol hydroxylase-like FAD-dependent oxidoreductase
MLGRRGFSVALIDPHEHYRPDFRCEKLEAHHVDALQPTGLLAELLPAAQRYRGIWIGRFGRICERRDHEEYGIDYERLVNRLRALVPQQTVKLRDTVRAVRLTPDHQVLTMASGDTLSCRLVVASTGLNAALLASLGMQRREISRSHSVSFGFDIEARSHFPFDALTYFGEAPQDRVAYLTLFPIGARMRANLFVYRDAHDPWLRRFREDPAAVLFETLPHLRAAVGHFNVAGPVKIRPCDLYVTRNAGRPGIVLVGDAHATACPTSGTGASKAIVDVERLCNVYVPAWLATEGMSADKIAEFYADPVKMWSDTRSLAKSIFAKRLALQPGARWALHRTVYFAGSFARGMWGFALNWGGAARRSANPL